jgi:hypothetical protein
MYAARMTVVTLSSLLDARDESLRVERTTPAWLSRAWARVKTAEYRPVTARAGALLAAVVLALAGFVAKHGLVLGGLATFVIAASMLSVVAAWIVAGVSLLFLEVRRR